MNRSSSQGRWLVSALVGSILAGCLGTVCGVAADYGRVTGKVTDTHGSPLVGATILLIGPSVPGSVDVVERVITDAQGKFSVEHLVPGWYSIKATAITRMPSTNDRIRVEGGLTAKQDFVLSDIFAPMHFRVPQGVLSTWGDDWKWVLRTSASTRPVLRYKETASNNSSKSAPHSKNSKKPVPASERLVGMTTGPSRHDPLASDAGPGSVLAYLRPLSDDADLLVVGSMAPGGIPGSSVTTAFRRNLMKGDPQELSLSVHELNFSEALPLPASGGSVADLGRAQGVVMSYANTRQLSASVRLITGFDVDYLNSVRDTAAARPHAELEYQLAPSTALAVRYGSVRMNEDSTLLDRVGDLNAFPTVTLRGNRPELETLNHTEAAVERRLSETSRVEVAVFHDGFQNTAVWGIADPQVVALLAGNVLPNPVANGLTLNAGSYGSSGFRAAYTRQLGNRVEAAIMYAAGDALGVDAGVQPAARLSNLRSALRAERSQSVAAKVCARVPGSKTRVVASYQWMPRDRVTSVDPYGEASLGTQPYLDVQVRQPLPYLAFLPAHIEAVADFRNLLAQGYVPVFVAGEDPLVLAAAYRSFRGGFSVQF
jgi:carboxypeptidase family protein